jgi:hypothetical protein
MGSHSISVAAYYCSRNSVLFLESPSQMKEYSEDEIVQAVMARGSNQIKGLHARYLDINQEKKKAWKAKDGAAYAGLSAQSHLLRNAIIEMFGTIKSYYEYADSEILRWETNSHFNYKLSCQLFDLENDARRAAEREGNIEKAKEIQSRAEHLKTVIAQRMHNGL